MGSKYALSLWKSFPDQPQKLSLKVLMGGFNSCFPPN